MKERYIVLRSDIGATRDVFRGGLAAPASTESIAAGLTVDVEEIDRRAVSSLTRKSDVLAIAPVVPMKLIAPVPTSRDADPIGAGAAWGVKAVGADTSPFSGAGIVV